MSSFWRQCGLVAVGFPLVFCALHLAGRYLKRHHGVRYGAMYHLFAMALSTLAVTELARYDFPMSQHLGAVVIVLAVFAVVPLLDRFLWQGYFRHRRQIELPTFFTQVVALLLFTTVGLLVLHVEYGLSVPGLLTGSGIAAIILGLAMQDLLSNILACFALYYGKPFRVGDWLILDNYHAQVTEVNWRSTRLRTTDDVYLDIPNSKISKETLVNVSYPTRLHAMRLRIGCSYEVPPNETRAALLRATACALGVCREPAPKVFLIDFADSTITYEVKFWMEDHALYSDIIDSIRTHVWYEFARCNMPFPFPVRHLLVDRPARKKADDVHTAALAILRQQGLFQCLTEAQREQLVRGAHMFRFGTNEKIIAQGDEGASMFLLLHGRADVMLAQGSFVGPVARLTDGACIGEMSLLTGERRSATVLAQTDCDVLEIDKSVLGEVLQQQPELLNRLSELLAQRRLENDTLRAGIAPAQAPAARREEYAQSFRRMLRAFFEL